MDFPFRLRGVCSNHAGQQRDRSNQVGRAQKHHLGRGIQDGPAPEQGAGDWRDGQGWGHLGAVWPGLPETGGLFRGQQHGVLPAAGATGDPRVRGHVRDTQD